MRRLAIAHSDQEISRRDDGSARALAQGLGWFSIGLGVAEVVAERLARFLGMEERTD